jgi:hypothetical protein
MRKFINCSFHKTYQLFGRQSEKPGQYSQHGDTRNEYKNFGRIPEGKRSLGKTYAQIGIILKCILKKQDWKAWTGLISLRKETSGEM